MYPSLLLSSSGEARSGLCSNSAAILTFSCGKEPTMGGKEAMPGESPPEGTREEHGERSTYEKAHRLISDLVEKKLKGEDISPYAAGLKIEMPSGCK